MVMCEVRGSGCMDMCDVLGSLDGWVAGWVCCLMVGALGLVLGLCSTVMCTVLWLCVMVVLWIELMDMFDVPGYGLELYVVIMCEVVW